MSLAIPRETISKLSPIEARTFFGCSVSCGKRVNAFKIDGILKFTASFQGEGESITSTELVFPDFIHIGMVFLQWYKTLIVAVAGLLIAVAVTYLVITTFGPKLLVQGFLYIPKLSLIDLGIISEGSAYLADFTFVSMLYQEASNTSKWRQALDTQLTHHLLSTTGVKIGGGELMMYVSRMLRTATYAKEKLLSFTQRYMLVHSIYRMSADSGKVSGKRRSEWDEDKKRDPNNVAAKVEYQIRMLDRYISDIEGEISRAEKMILAEKVQNTVNFSNTFDIAMDKMEKRLLSAIANLTKKRRSVPG
ncbi:hypothetical protein COOONC_01678 [Cooperia oncophora]